MVPLPESPRSESLSLPSADGIFHLPWKLVQQSLFGISNSHESVARLLCSHLLLLFFSFLFFFLADLPPFWVVTSHDSILSSKAVRKVFLSCCCQCNECNLIHMNHSNVTSQPSLFESIYPYFTVPNGWLRLDSSMLWSKQQGLYLHVIDFGIPGL